MVTNLRCLLCCLKFLTDWVALPVFVHARYCETPVFHTTVSDEIWAAHETLSELLVTFDECFRFSFCLNFCLTFSMEKTIFLEDKSLVKCAFDTFVPLPQRVFKGAHSLGVVGDVFLENICCCCCYQ